MNPDFQNLWPGGVAGQGDSFPPQWSMSSGTQYNMNVPQEQVDWASLAQQWIRMKEETPADKEGGEAPMELAKDEPLPNLPQNLPWQSGSHPPPPEGNWSSNWGWDQNNTWCWNSSKPPPAANFPGTTYPPGLIPTEPPVQIPPQNVFCYTAPQIPVQPDTYSTSSGYWAGASSEPKETWENNSVKKKEVVIDSPPELDAAKRKQLPAWIREGLEKMEREKQKKAENDKMEKLRQEELLKKSELASANANSNGECQLPPKSKFDSDSEESEPEVVTQMDQRKPRFAPLPVTKATYKTKEQILQSCMVDVRKILTQILMEVTSEEIHKAVNETYKKFKKKAPAATIRKTPALSSLTGKLGLGIYESDSGSESEPEKVTDPDSDQDIRDRIERLKNEFVKIEVRIEKEVAEQEEKERKQLRNDTNNEVSSYKVEEQVQPIIKGAVKDKHVNQQLKIKDTNDAKRERTAEKDIPKEYKKIKDRRSRSYNSSQVSSSNSRSPSPYYKKKNKHHHKRYSRSSSRSRSRSRSRSKSRERRHKNKSRRHRSGSRKRYRGRRRSSSSSSGDHHSRKSGRRK